MRPGRVKITVELDNGVITYSGNVGNAEAVGILEATKFLILRNSSGGGTGRPPVGDPATESSGSGRAPGFVVRSADQPA